MEGHTSSLDLQLDGLEGELEELKCEMEQIRSKAYARKLTPRSI
jgi:hypothetical protein